MARDLVLEKVTKRFGKVPAVDEVSLEIKEGEFACFLGPSGCGKTTLLRMISGFETVSGGRIHYDGRVINDLIPQKRNFGIVFQSYALFPNMNVFDNVAFGLRARKVPRARAVARVGELLDLVGLSDYASMYPAQLSGGQQQRVALVRALAPNPSVLLLDEPLSALDARIRVYLRSEIKRLQRELGITMIYVTHDQEEALSLADWIVVMDRGRVQQVGSAIEIYRSPASRFVADFVGTSNFLDCNLRHAADHLVEFRGHLLRVASPLPNRGDRLSLAIRPERIEILKRLEDLGEREPRNVLQATVDTVTFFGAVARLITQIDREPLIVDLPQRDFDRLSIHPGEPVRLYLPPEGFMIYPELSEMGKG